MSEPRAGYEGPQRVPVVPFQFPSHESSEEAEARRRGQAEGARVGLLVLSFLAGAKGRAVETRLEAALEILGMPARQSGRTRRSVQLAKAEFRKFMEDLASPTE